MKTLFLNTRNISQEENMYVAKATCKKMKLQAKTVKFYVHFAYHFKKFEKVNLATYTCLWKNELKSCNKEGFMPQLILRSSDPENASTFLVMATAVGKLMDWLGMAQAIFSTEYHEVHGKKKTTHVCSTQHTSIAPLVIQRQFF